MTNDQIQRVVVAGIVLAVAALIGGYLGLIFGGLTDYALTVTV
jgi:hypothetical protein